mmetsp:Transcript_23270/g.59424  ORF Transcript_23270/g.59424 Transcript_23270/m.59424 type:complete len:81 (+) Transcript_23270:827-1069(+)
MFVAALFAVVAADDGGEDDVVLKPALGIEFLSGGGRNCLRHMGQFVQDSSAVRPHSQVRSFCVVSGGMPAAGCARSFFNK